MSLDAIKALLLNKIGLDTATIGDSSLQHALDKRCEAVQRESIADYYQLLSVERRELDALIEEIVVPETWFYRNKQPFVTCVERVVQLQKQRLGAGEPVRILSVPCSTGEEPYSIAMALVEANVNLGKVVIFAQDISRSALNAARSASYHRNSLREMTPGLQEKYFTQQGGRFLLNEKIRDMVKFEQANVIYSSFSPHPGYFDIIFCRNLLIYFNDKLRAQIYEKLERALTPEGWLFVGHVETAHVDKRRFQAHQDKHSYAFIRLNGRSSRLSPVSATTEAPKITEQGQIDAAQKKPVPMAGGQSVISLNFVNQLIEKGDDARAEHLLRQFLEQHRDHLEALFLEGKRLFCSDKLKQAESWLKKLLYQYPNHKPSLQLLLQIAEKRYDLAAVRNYRNRLNRDPGV